MKYILSIWFFTIGICAGTALENIFPSSPHDNTYWYLTLGQCACFLIIVFILLSGKPLFKEVNSDQEVQGSDTTTAK